MSDVNCRVYTLWLSDDMMKSIKLIAIQDGVSVASIVRELLSVSINIRHAELK